MPVLVVSALLTLPQMQDVKMAFRGLLDQIHTSCIHRSVRPYGVSLSAFKGGVPLNWQMNTDWDRGQQPQMVGYHGRRFHSSDVTKIGIIAITDKPIG